jgi:DNA-binding CsgD family transcriptional regulator
VLQSITWLLFAAPSSDTLPHSTVMASSPNPGSTFAALTGKQHEVLALVADNRTSKEIAAELGVSESAVNQRIEAVRARLGGLPRAQMAREYRLFAATYTPDETCKPIPWQRIQLPQQQPGSQSAAAESVSGHTPGPPGVGDGLQLSVTSFGASLAPAARGVEASPFTHYAGMAAIVLAGMLAAYLVTTLVGIG